MMHYVHFTTKQQAVAFINRVSRLGWTCSTPWEHPGHTWSVCTNY